jgi:small subunit ribosomal protein S1
MKSKYTSSEYTQEERENLEALYDSTFGEESESSGYTGKDLVNNQALKIKIASVNRERNVAMGESSTGQSIFIDMKKEEKGFRRLGQAVFDIVEGMELDVIIRKTSNGDITGSVSAGYELTLKRELHRAIKEQDCAYNVRVKEVCNGGFMVDLSGIKCFLPGSLAAANRIFNFSEYVGKEITVMVETYDQRRDIFVVSFKKYLKKVINEKVKELSLTAEYTGKVTGASGKGVFVEWNELYTGIINFNNENEGRLRELKPGDEVSFYVYDIKNPNRITLSVSEPTEKSKNVQEMKDSSYEVLGETDDSKIYMGEITKIKTFGAFVKLDNGLTGLIEKEKLVDPIEDYEVGQEVSCHVSSVDVSSLKIQLTER